MGKRRPGYRRCGHAHRRRNRALNTIVINGGTAFILGNGETLTNTNNTIVGTGIIGNSNLVLINGR